MKFYTTLNKNIRSSFENAVLKGLADDGGLYMPVDIPQFEPEFIKEIKKYSFQEISFRIAEKFASEDISESSLGDIITNAINFPAPVYSLTENIHILELFHGPTLAFKDFGARFLSKTMGYFVSHLGTELNILVATSGDTGSAVANGFYNVPGINVFILYPKGKVSLIQEKQLTTLGNNITALEIEGTFDDCQRLVKQAFVDKDLSSRKNLTSANSISMARLLPQVFYYFEAYRQIKEKNKELYFSVPSGNLGNLTAGLIAKKMGLPVTKFVSATNKNDVFTQFIKRGIFEPRKSELTISNAMDVGNPSNFYRITDLYSGSAEEIRKDIFSETFSDDSTRIAMKEIFKSYKYIIDPHSSVGYLALESFLKQNSANSFNGIILSTAHPAKFKDIVENEINAAVEIPERLAKCLGKEKTSHLLSTVYDDLKEFLLN